MTDMAPTLATPETALADTVVTSRELGETPVVSMPSQPAPVGAPATALEPDTSGPEPEPPRPSATAILCERSPIPSPPPRPGSLIPEAPADPAAVERRARLVLHHAADAGDPLICRLVRRFGHRS